MNKEQFYTYLNNPDNLNESSLKVLNEIITEYPYFQTAHLLYLKNLHNLGHLRFTKQLRVSSTYLADREILYNSLYSKPIVYTEDEFLQQNASEKSNTKLKNKAKTSTKKKTKGKLEISRDESSVNKSEKESISRKKPDTQINKVNKKKTKTSVAEASLSAEATHSFAEWLEIFHKRQDENKYDKSTSITKNEKEQKRLINDTKEDEIKSNQDKLITNFINSEPKIKVSASNKTEQKDISKESIKEDDSFITETLAKIYVSQKHFGKAINAYEKLSLKYPEKNIYFANQIKEITKLINK